MTEKVIKILTHVAAGIGGAVIGGSIVFASTKKKYYNDVESIRSYYRSKKKKVVDVPKKEEPVEEERPDISLGSDDIRREFLAPPTPAEFIDYRSFSRAKEAQDKVTDILEPVQANLDEPYEIEASEYGVLEGYDTKTYTHFSNGVITDEEFNVVDNPEDVLGQDYDKILEQDNYQSVVYIRNSTTMVDYCLSPVDKPFYE